MFLKFMECAKRVSLIRERVSLTLETGGVFDTRKKKGKGKGKGKGGVFQWNSFQR